MKKSMIFAMCAFAFAFASCEQNGGSDVPAGELEQSYVAITLASTDATGRAFTEDYAEGTEKERAIKSAYVFFYDAAGEPFPVTPTAAGTPGGNNYLAITLSDSTKNLPNVESVKKKVLVLNGYKGIYPSQVVAVLNYTPALGDEDKTIEDLQETLVDFGNVTNGFVMTNSVYADAANNLMVGAPLTAANIATTASGAMEAPVKIYVERVAAKVAVNANGDVDVDSNPATVDHMYSLKNTYINGPGGEQVYAKVLGWEVVNYTNSYFLKNIDVAWANGNLEFTWNNISFHRSYWAKTQEVALPELDLRTLGDADAFDPKYTGENTNTAVDKQAEVVIKAQLCTYNSTEGQYKPCALAKWFGYEYVGETNLLTAVRNNIMSTYYYLEGGSYVAIGVGDLKTVAGNGTGAAVYEVYFQLSDTGDDKTWYVRENGQFVSKTVVEMNTALAAIQPALFYAEGYTYYRTPIVHNITNDVKVNGVVRNHVYNITINSIHGYGTPITTNNVVTPSTPVETSSYVAAQIDVLSWRTVSYEVDL